MQNVVGPTLVAIATTFGLGTEIQSPTGLYLCFPVFFSWLVGKLHFCMYFNVVCLLNFWQKLEDEGEDDTTVRAHLEVLQLECRRRDPNLDVLAEKMSKTFRHRRDFIRHNLSVPRVLEEYPALKTESVVSSFAEQTCCLWWEWNREVQAGFCTCRLSLWPE